MLASHLQNDNEHLGNQSISACAQSALVRIHSANVILRLRKNIPSTRKYDVYSLPFFHRNENKIAIGKIKPNLFVFNWIVFIKLRN